MCGPPVLPSLPDGIKYSMITVDSFEDAVIAVLYNHDIQAVVFTADFDLHTDPRGCPYRMLVTSDGFEKLQGVRLRARDGGVCMECACPCVCAILHGQRSGHNSLVKILG